MEIKTKTGFELEIDLSRLSNYELLDAISELDGNPLILPKVVTLLLGKEQKEKLMDHLRGADGLVPMEKVESELLEIFNGVKDLKN